MVQVGKSYLTKSESFMTNINDIIFEDKKAYSILKIAGELGEKHNLKVFVVAAKFG